MVAQLVNNYVELDEFKDAVRDQLTAHDAEYVRAINAASRQMDDYCSRTFYQSALSARVYRPQQVDILFTDDISTTTGLLVATDDDGDGVYENSWTITTDFVPGPQSRINGLLAYEYIEAMPTKAFPVDGVNVATPMVGLQNYRRRNRRPRVQVTAKWGFAAVPDAVKQATIIAALDHFRAKDLSNIAQTYAAGVRLATDSTPGNFGRSIKFNRVRAPSLNPQAEALISPYRKTVLA